MGLDMYLRAERYVSQSGVFGGDEEKDTFSKLVEMFPDVREPVENTRFSSVQVQFQVGYWRKANHIHSWFVNQCQNGVDECQITYVPREKLSELRETCLRVLASRSVKVAEELLAPQEGLFFGDVSLGESDEWYWQDLEDTVKILDRVLALPKGWAIYYQSSW